jgi:hypothetical protein
MDFPLFFLGSPPGKGVFTGSYGCLQCRLTQDALSIGFPCTFCAIERA